MNDDGGDSNATVFIGEPLEDGSYTHMRIGNEVSACRQSSSVVGAVYFVPRAPLYGTGPRLTPPPGGRRGVYIYIRWLDPCACAASGRALLLFLRLHNLHLWLFSFCEFE